MTTEASWRLLDCLIKCDNKNEWLFNLRVFALGPNYIVHLGLLLECAAVKGKTRVMLYYCLGLITIYRMNDAVSVAWL